jgi:acetylornithine aminotransferase
MSQHLMNTYARLPVAFVRGEGAWLWDEQGKRYLDAISGLGVCSLGHAHPQVASVIAEQAGLLLHSGNLVRIPWQERLADRLAEITRMDRVFFGNSGAEAIECALKICRLVGHARGQDNPGVIVMEHSFHGRTLAALSATGSRKVQAGFEPLVGGFVRAPFGDAEAVRTIARRRGDISAILLEPIQGEAGIRVPPPGYLAALRAVCDEHGWLLIVDEIQAGLCRTGKWYAHQHEEVLPDILTTAKALANGLPIGACAARGAAAEAFTPGRHGSTFGGNPLVTRTACTVLDIMRDEDLPRRPHGRRNAGEFTATPGAAYGGAGCARPRPDARHRAGPGRQSPGTALERGLLINVPDKVIPLPPIIDPRGRVTSTGVSWSRIESGPLNRVSSSSGNGPPASAASRCAFPRSACMDGAVRVA